MVAPLVSILTTGRARKSVLNIIDREAKIEKKVEAEELWVNAKTEGVGGNGVKKIRGMRKGE